MPASFEQSLGVDDGAMAKLKYQTLVGEFSELQKDFVSRERKLLAAKQNRDTILAEVRFLRRRRNDLLQNEAFNTVKDPVRLSNSYLKSKALKGELSSDGPDAVPENSNRFLLTDSHNGDTYQGVTENEVLEPMNGIIHQKTAGKRKISCLTKSR